MKRHKRYMNPLTALAYQVHRPAPLGQIMYDPLTPWLKHLGYHRYKGELRASRSLDPVEREARRFDLFPRAIRAVFGFPISKEEYLIVVRVLIAERKRRNRRRLPWGPGVTIELKKEAI